MDLLQRIISKQVHILLCPVNLSFPLSPVGGGITIYSNKISYEVAAKILF